MIEVKRWLYLSYTPMGHVVGHLDAEPFDLGRQLGTTTRTPTLFKSAMFERATRLCRMSPQIATVRPPSRPRRWRIVSASSKAWVGCSWLSSLALTTAQSTCSETRCIAPDSGGGRPAHRGASRAGLPPCRSESHLYQTARR